MRDMLWAMVVAIGAPPAASFLGVPASAASASVTASVTPSVTAPAVAPSAPVVRAIPAPERDAEAPRGLPGESIPTYDVVLTVRPDGVLHVRETITYDFRGQGEHGIVRRVPYRVKNRLYDIRDVRTSSSTGAPARARATRMLHELRISVGGEHRRVSGRQAYVIEYDVAGALTPLPDGRSELRWDAIGTGWDVPIGEVSVRVETPVRPLGVGCRAGSRRHADGADGAGLTPCGRDRDGPLAVDFTQGGLRPHESVLIKVLLPKGAVAVPPPRYARPHFAASWPGCTALALGLAAALALRLPRSGRRLAVFPQWRPAAVWRPGRRTGTVLLAAGAALVLLDAADDVVARGFWAASVGDPALVGLGLLAPGMIIISSGRRRGAPEREATEDQRA
jgi:hypothetical protein